jgi:hypothetical protein
MIEFFNSVKTPVMQTGKSSTYNIYPHQQLAIQVTCNGKISIDVQVCQGDSDGKSEWITLTGISKDFELTEKIKESNLYYYSIAGSNYVRLVINEISGKATITGNVS